VGHTETEVRILVAFNKAVDMLLEP
jgi:hypothetical protein